MSAAATRLAALEPRCRPEQALALFDELPAVAIPELSGRWAGRELGTGHPWDGLLTAAGWYGKRFDGPDAVHPLLFRSPGGRIYPVEPRRIPLRLVGRVPGAAVATGRRLLGVLEPVLRAGGPRARLRAVEHRGRVSAAMVYDHLPIIDLFRRVDERTVLGVMDCRGIPQPLFFVLTREPAAPGASGPSGRRRGVSGRRAAPPRAG